jgi:restriction endonuclease S subunit
MSTTTPARRLRPYPAYRDSGLPWLGEVPEHWHIWKLAHAFKNIGSGTTPPTSQYDEYYSDDGILWVNTSELRDGYIYSTTKKVTPKAIDDFSVLRVYPSGTLLVALYGATIGKVGILKANAATNQACCALSGSSILNTRFVFYWLLAHRTMLLWLAYGGGQPNISQEVIRGLRVPTPPLPEQRAIVAYLDRKLAQIDQYIANKRRLIDLLREQKQAIINHAVTRGLDPAAPRKPSGVEWLGEIPAGWEIVPLKRYWTVIDCKHRTVPFIEEGIPVASIAEVKNMIINLSQAKKTTYDEYLQLIEGKRKPQVGDIIYSRNATVGEAAFVNVNVDFCMGQDVSLIRSSKQNQWFLTYQLRSDCVLHQLENFMVGSTFRRINVADIKALLICYPPIAEQQIIAEYLDQETEKVNTVIAQAEREIELMQEYRTTLISDVVTGKVDVRESKDL